MTEPTGIEKLLRDALETPPDDDLLSQMSRGALIAEVSQDPNLRRVVEEMTSPVRAELDLHLDGAGVTGHETQAYAFGRLVTRTAEAVKEIAKTASGLSRLAPRLQVVGPEAGSVRVVLRAPESHRSAGDVIQGSQSETIEAVAMRRLTALLLQAEKPDDEESPLDATVYGLRGEARRAVRLVGKTVVEAHWNVSGELRQRGHETTRVTLSEAGAQRLVEATTATELDVTEQRLHGLVDGWTWSEQTMSFLPEHGPRLRVVVEDEALQERVAGLVQQHDQPVVASLTVVTRFPRGDTQYVRRSYSLNAIELTSPDVPLSQDPPPAF